MGRPRTPLTRFVTAIVIFTAAASAAAVLVFLRLSDEWVFAAPALVLGVALMLADSLLRARFVLMAPVAAAAAVLILTAGHTARETSLAVDGRVTTVVVSDVAEAGVLGLYWYEFTEVGTGTVVGWQTAQPNEHRPDERLDVVVDPAGRLDPVPLADARSITFEWLVTGMSLLVTALFGGLASRSPR